MRTSLVTREEMIEAIEQHTACISTRDIPGVIANYFMITKQLYRRKDKNAVHRILLSDIREYLLEQGHLNYATVAAEARKEAHRMKATNVKSEKIHAPSVQESELVVVQNQSDEIPVLEWQGVRVVTTETLARGYGTETIRIRQNHHENKVRFVEGKHFFKVEGESLRELKHRVALNYSVKIARNVRSLTLWTERGAARHAKMLETDQAWAFFEKLEDSYFRQKEQQPINTHIKQIFRRYIPGTVWINHPTFCRLKPVQNEAINGIPDHHCYLPWRTLRWLKDIPSADFNRFIFDAVIVVGNIFGKEVCPLQSINFDRELPSLREQHFVHDD